MKLVNEESDADYPCFDIPATLRMLASQVESGEINALGCVVLFNFVDQVSVHGIGPGMDSECAVLTMEAGIEMIEEFEEDDDQ